MLNTLKYLHGMQFHIYVAIYIGITVQQKLLCGKYAWLNLKNIGDISLIPTGSDIK